MRELIVGGNAGVGLSIAQNSYHGGRQVIVTGEESVRCSYGELRKFKFRPDSLAEDIERFVRWLPPIGALVYTALYNREGPSTRVSEEDEELRLSVGLKGPELFSKNILDKQGLLNELVIVSPLRSAVPSRADSTGAMIRNGVADLARELTDERIVDKALVVEPILELDASLILPSALAATIMRERGEDFRGYRHTEVSSTATQQEVGNGE